jgi:hypothetical protein
MVKHLLLAGIATTILSNVQAQVLADFENLTLSPDSFYLNIDSAGYTFESGLILLNGRFTQEPWGVGGTGFTYSNRVDTTQCLTCYDVAYQMAARPGSGNNGSANYAMAYAYEPVSIEVIQTTDAHTSVQSTAIANSSWGYAYANATYNVNNEGWAKVTIKNLDQPTDSIDVYLADFRASTPEAERGVLDGWKEIDLTMLGEALNIGFNISSSDDFFPAYFALDDILVNRASSIRKQNKLLAEVYPNPVKSTLHIQSANDVNVRVIDVLGKSVMQANAAKSLDLSTLTPGNYLLELTDINNKSTIIKLINKL